MTNSKNFIRLLLFITIIVTLFALAINYAFSTGEILNIVLFVVYNILLTLLVILIMNRRTSSILNNSKKEMLNAIENFNLDSLDSNDKFLAESKHKEFSEIYKALETLYTNLYKREQMRGDVLKLVGTASSNMDLSVMLNELMPKISEATYSEWCAFYQTNEITNKLELKYSLGFSRNIYSEYDLSIGEGFVGLAALTRRIQILKDMPDDTIYVTRTVLGKIKPKNLMTVPVINQDKLLGVIVLASVYEYSEYSKELIDFINYYLGIAIGNGITYERTKRLTNELQFQNKLIQNLNEDLESKVQERTEFLNSVLNSIQDYAIYSVDKNGYITTWNKCAEYKLGYVAEDIIGEHISLLYTEEEVKSDILNKRINLARINGRFSENNWRSRRDGTRCFMEMTFYAMYNDDNDMVGITCISKDVTGTDLENPWL